MMASVPTQNGQVLDGFNAQLRASPLWQQFVRAQVGTDPDGATKRDVRLTDNQRRQLQQMLEQAGYQFPHGMEIDAAGNVNQKTHGVGYYAGKVGAYAAPVIAAPFTGGLSLAAIGAGAGAANAALDHGGLGTYLKDIGIGIGSGFGARALLGTGSSGAINTAFDTPPAWGAGGYANAADLGSTAAGGFAAAPGVGSAATGVVDGGTVAPTFNPAFQAAAGGGSTGAVRRLLGAVTDPKDIAGLAALLPVLTSVGGGGSNSSLPGGDALNNEITQSLALQRQRVQQAQPVYDTLVNMAYGMSPTRYRGATPTGYPAGADAPAASYAYQPPRFG